LQQFRSSRSLAVNVPAITALPWPAVFMKAAGYLPPHHAACFFETSAVCMAQTFAGKLFSKHSSASADAHAAPPDP